ncbi:MAG TPA: hypothetical protein VN081_01450 [Dongiaceae bacterium]|nr:hypothetical protein [Dongiaceae bacterium]
MVRKKQPQLPKVPKHGSWLNPTLPRPVAYAFESLAIMVVSALIGVMAVHAYKVATTGSTTLGGIVGLTDPTVLKKQSEKSTTPSGVTSQTNSQATTGAAPSGGDNNATTSTGGSSSGDVPDGPTVQSSVYGWLKNAGNTGLTSVGISCSNLPIYSGAAKLAAGTSLSRVRFTSPVDFSNGNITIDRACFQPTSAGQGVAIASAVNPPATVTITNTDFDGSRLDQKTAAFSTCFQGVANILNVYCHHFGSGFNFTGTGSQLDASVSNSYVTDLVAWGNASNGGNRSIAMGVYDYTTASAPSRRFIMNNNRFDCSSANAAGALVVQTANGDIANMTIFANLLEGGGYSTGLSQVNSHAYAALVFTNNRLTNNGLGYGYVQGGPNWDTWSNNFQNDPSKTDNKGATVPRP